MKHILVIILSALYVICAYADTGTEFRNAQSLLAEGQYRKAADIYQRVAPALPTVMRTAAYSDLGICLKHLGRYAEANEAYKSALAMCRTQTQRDRILNNYANYLLETGDYGRAEAMADSIKGPELVPQKLILLAHIRYFRDKDLTRATRLLESCRNGAKIAPALKRIATQNLGFMQMEHGHYDEAIALFNESLEGLPREDEYHQTLGNIALTNAKAGNCAQATHDITQVLKYFRGRNDADYRIALRKAGEISAYCGKYAEAVRYMREFFAAEKTSVNVNLATMDIAARMNLWLMEKPRLSKIFLVSETAPDLAYDAALYRRLTSLAGIRDIGRLSSLLSTTHKDVASALQKGEAAVEIVSFKDANGQEVYGALILAYGRKPKFVSMMDEDLIYQPEKVGTNSILNAIKRESPYDKNALYSDSTLGNLVWHPIVSALPEGTTDIYFAPEGIFHFWGIESMPFAGKETYNLHRLTSTALLRERQNAPNSKGNALVVGGLSYSFCSLDTAVSGNHEALETLKRYTLGKDWFKPLPWTFKEANAVGGRLTPSTVSNTMTEAQLKREMSDYRLVHIATHGYSLNLGVRSRPDFAADSAAYDVSLNTCGLALSGANVLGDYPQQEDGILSAREICDLDLSNVDFVVLSACQTAKGDLTDEGCAGIVRGLKNAGVKTIMATLWAVNDHSTMKFMNEFYRLLKAGLTKHEAYIGAQNYLRAYAEPVEYHTFSPATLANDGETYTSITTYNPPYFWAPFILIDDY